MPSKSPAQARLMAAVAHGWHKPGGGGPPVSVTKEFNSADKGSGMIKGMKPMDMKYAEGGPVLGHTRDFMKIKDEFRDPDERNPNADEDNKYGKSGDGAGRGS